jgi:hypothetical protein
MMVDDRTNFLKESAMFEVLLSEVTYGGLVQQRERILDERKEKCECVGRSKHLICTIAKTSAKDVT